MASPVSIVRNRRLFVKAFFLVALTLKTMLPTIILSLCQLQCAANYRVVYGCIILLQNGLLRHELLLMIRNRYCFNAVENAENEHVELFISNKAQKIKN